MDYDKISDVSLEEEMKGSYIKYAMSVIVSRALPDVRDGLKPVHRRILYAMNELNLDPSKPYKKSARVVGDTMGKYHPHGESSIYDAMVRMAQEFSMRYMLVDGHGNFGSVDGDGAAAQRYTEARLSKIAMHLLSDIEKQTVDFKPNYTEEFLEPEVLPSRFPNLLVNGSSGIAVGMATNIPPHNLGEIIDAVVKIIDNHIDEGRETTIQELLEIVKGPDFPTAGNIMGSSGIKSAYMTGRGKLIVRANAVIETVNNKSMIVVDEIPYMVNKAKLQEKIADLIRDKKIDGISDIHEQSDRNGMRIVFDIKRDANPNVVLNNLYKYSQMQDSFGIIMLALVDGEPKVLNLKQMLEYYLQHQKDVVIRRTKFELAKARKREHILDGLIIALDNIDEVISIIRSSADARVARGRLIERFYLSEEQSTAIVDMRLRALTGMEREKLEAEINEIKALIAELTLILEDENKLYSIIKDEILIIRDKFSDGRRTKIVHDATEIIFEDLIDDEPNVVTMTHLDYIKRLPLNTYKSQNRGGKGIIGIQTRDEDIVSNLFVTNTHSTILFFTNLGKVRKIRTFEIPEVGRTARGTAIVNLLELNSEEKIAAAIPVDFSSDTNERYLMMVTKKGIIKKTSMSHFLNIRTTGLTALNIQDDDELITVFLTNGTQDIFVATNRGKAALFNEKAIRPMGRTATGVRGIRLSGGDYVIGASVAEKESKVLFVSSLGYGKCTKISEFNVKNRGIQGSIAYKITEKTGTLVGIVFVNDNEEVMLINSEGLVIRLRVADIANSSRNTMGVKLFNLPKDVTVNSLAKISEDHIEDNIEE
ncbi:MAG: DNA gyrase subunit A [Clostridiales bacterium]|nr:DNA gyrase subunit A [Clostridiales bacterium]